MGKLFFDEPATVSLPASLYGGRVIRPKDLEVGRCYRFRYSVKKGGRWVEAHTVKGDVYSSSTVFRFDKAHLQHPSGLTWSSGTVVQCNSPHYCKGYKLNACFHLYKSPTMPFFEEAFEFDGQLEGTA